MCRAPSPSAPHCLLLVFQGRARQIDVHLVLADLLLLGREEFDPEPGGIVGQGALPSSGMAAMSQPSTPAQKLPRRTGSCASKLSA